MESYQKNENQSLITNLPSTTLPASPKNAKKKKKVLLIIAIIILVGIGGVGLFLRHLQTAKSVSFQTPNTISIYPTAQSAAKNTSVGPDILQKSAGSSLSTDNLPLGDGKYTITGPQKGYIYLCSTQMGQGMAEKSGDWIHGNTWTLSEKPSVEGSVSWPNAVFSDTISNNSRIVSGNDLPVNATTGIFPIAATDPAYQYDTNPNMIEPHLFTDTLPLYPVYLSSPHCMGGEVGVMLNGVALFNGFDAGLRDAPAHEIQDSCQGHPQEDDEYHYHSLSKCIKDIHETTVIGFALDGFPITGPVLPNGKYLKTADLDECHGITSVINLDGKQTETYHYVMTEDFPYSASCFRGKPVSLMVISNLRNPGSMQNTMQGSTNQIGLGNSQNQMPPQAAFVACSDKNNGDSCSFSASRGQINGTCINPPNQNALVCAPQNNPNP